jgi:hypothetical protein
MIATGDDRWFPAVGSLANLKFTVAISDPFISDPFISDRSNQARRSFAR